MAQRKNLDKIIIAENSKFYQVITGAIYKEIKKDSKMELLKEYLHGFFIGCFCSGHKLDYKKVIQNLPQNYKGSYLKILGKPLPNDAYKKILKSFCGDDRFS